MDKNARFEAQDRKRDDQQGAEDVTDVSDSSNLEMHRGSTKSPDAFRTISEVASDLDVPPHVLRFWETKFTQIKPLKRGGGRRYYRPEDVLLLKRIRSLLYVEGYTIKGVQRLLKENGVRTAAQVINVPERVPPESDLAKKDLTPPKKVMQTVTKSAPQPPSQEDLTKAMEELKALKAALAPYRSDD